MDSSGRLQLICIAWVCGTIRGFLEVFCIIVGALSLLLDQTVTLFLGFFPSLAPFSASLVVHLERL